MDCPAVKRKQNVMEKFKIHTDGNFSQKTREHLPSCLSSCNAEREKFLRFYSALTRYHGVVEVVVEA